MENIRSDIDGLTLHFSTFKIIVLIPACRQDNCVDKHKILHEHKLPSNHTFFIISKATISSSGQYISSVRIDLFFLTIENID